MDRGSERKVPHIGTETRVVNLFCRRVKYATCSVLQVSEEKASANSVPAAAVIRRMQALSGFIGFKGCVGGTPSQR